MPRQRLMRLRCLGAEAGARPTGASACEIAAVPTCRGCGCQDQRVGGLAGCRVARGARWLPCAGWTTVGPVGPRPPCLFVSLPLLLPPCAEHCAMHWTGAQGGGAAPLLCSCLPLLYV